MSVKKLPPIPNGYSSWNNWFIINGDTRMLHLEYIDRGLSYTRDDIREAAVVELAALQQDRERVKWREEHKNCDVRYNAYLSEKKWIVVEYDELHRKTGRIWRGETWSEAIDSAMNAGEGD